MHILCTCGEENPKSMMQIMCIPVKIPELKTYGEECTVHYQDVHLQHYLQLLLSCIFVSFQNVLTQVVPDVHFSTQRSNFDDTLTQEIIRLPLQTLLHSGLDVIVFVPNPNFDAV